MNTAKELALLSAKEIALVSMFTALLIGGQFVLSPIAGVEVVTVLLLAFSYYFGIVRGVFVANAFSWLRCFLFGFFPTVVILYLVYYNLFVVVFGLLGMKFKKRYDWKIHIAILFVAMIMTAFFTGLDDLITPLFYGYDGKATAAYAVASVPTLITQEICTLVTVTFLFPVLIRVFSAVRMTGNKKR